MSTDGSVLGAAIVSGGGAVGAATLWQRGYTWVPFVIGFVVGFIIIALRAKRKHVK